jgi:serine/threonine-protein kinase
MAPEQALDSHLADHTSDIYSLGATLHFLLVGQPLFGGNTLMARILAHRENPAPSLRSSRPEIPQKIDLIYQKMVAKKKEDRYPSMTDLIRELTNWETATLSTPPPRSSSPASPSVSSDSISTTVINAIFDD